MYAIIAIGFFVAAFLSHANTYEFIGLMIVSALFAIAAAISSIYTAMISKTTITVKKEQQK